MIQISDLEAFLNIINLNYLFPLFNYEEIDYELLSVMTKNDYNSIGVNDQEYILIINNLNNNNFVTSG
jgi:hypothetical protein